MTKSQKNKLFLAFDYSGKRVGVAMGDASIGIAHPIKAISYKTSKELMAEIERIVSEWKPSALVVGMPRKESGEPHSLEKRVNRFCKTLESRFKLMVHTIDESYTSVEADQFLSENKVGWEKRKKMIDMVAAQLILEDFFIASSGDTESRA
ncbi:MAG: Holliday junction resolvase RuvX [Betaproteobacteria bacterium]|nr:Holliday junction resolvase RuvX [Betaproteobacteria bacterium]